ncbi:MAG: LysM peptidoglycan-binding domain-containing M23 family metallopeptidase [Leptospira sp.]|jgi:murein DD-endopeptidase MepM/ murein hydrolase activator NlpD|nr:LysM peptidoglycan-binding domain-containing M23 family metallopeptidase [Leptospira sp.]
MKFSIGSIGCLLIIISLPVLSKQTATNQIPNTYRVESKDTWFGIAKKFQTTAEELAKMNGREPKENLFVGERLRIPLGKNSIPSVSQPKENPDFPLIEKEKIAKHFSEITYNPYKGMLFQRGKHSLVRATLPGKVVLIDFMDGYLNYIILEHTNGYYSIYGNLEKIQVVEGQIVQKRERLGTLGKEKGLYFQINRNKTVVNPERFLEIGT